MIFQFTSEDSHIWHMVYFLKLNSTHFPNPGVYPNVYKKVVGGKYDVKCCHRTFQLLMFLTGLDIPPGLGNSVKWIFLIKQKMLHSKNIRNVILYVTIFI